MKLRIGATAYEVEVRVDADTVRLVVDGVERRVPWRRLPDGTIVVDAGGRPMRAWSDGEWAVADGRARRVSREGGRAVAVEAGEVTPPMPGTVVKVLVAVGEAVTAGQRLIVVSAMKTETPLRAPRDGVVTAVNAAPGDAVRPGQVLVELE